jgi:hypothetical protein
MRAKNKKLEEPARFELATIRCDNPRCLRPVTRTRESARVCLPLYPLSYDSSMCLDASPGIRLDAGDAGASVPSTTHRRPGYMPDQGDGSRTRSQGSTTPCADPLTPPPIDPVEAPPERFELPTPWFVARCSGSAELRRRIGVGRRAPCLRRGVVEHRARAGGLHEPIDERDQRDLHPHPSGRQPVAPLLSYGPSVVRLRHDVTAGTPGSGSRVNPLPIAPCHAGRRRSTCCRYCVFLPRPSVVKQRFLDRRCGSLDSLRSLGMTRGCHPERSSPRHPERSRGISTSPIPMGETRTPHLAFGAGGACRTAPIR